MADLSNLKKSISEMGNDELLERIKSIRANRRISKVKKETKPKVEKAPKQTKPKKSDVEEALSKMSKEDKLALIQALLQKKG